MQLEAVEALLEHERAEGQAREQRHKLTVERLRRQITTLQVSARARPPPAPCHTLVAGHSPPLHRCRWAVASSTCSDLAGGALGRGSLMLCPRRSIELRATQAGRNPVPAVGQASRRASGLQASHLLTT